MKKLPIKIKMLINNSLSYTSTCFLLFIFWQLSDNCLYKLRNKFVEVLDLGFELLLDETLVLEVSCY